MSKTISIMRPAASDDVIFSAETAVGPPSADITDTCVDRTLEFDGVDSSDDDLEMGSVLTEQASAPHSVMTEDNERNSEMSPDTVSNDSNSSLKSKVVSAVSQISLRFFSYQNKEDQATPAGSGDEKEHDQNNNKAEGSAEKISKIDNPSTTLSDEHISSLNEEGHDADARNIDDISLDDYSEDDTSSDFKKHDEYFETNREVTEKKEKKVGKLSNPSSLGIHYGWNEDFLGCKTDTKKKQAAAISSMQINDDNVIESSSNQSCSGDSDDEDHDINSQKKFKKRRISAKIYENSFDDDEDEEDDDSDYEEHEEEEEESEDNDDDESEHSELLRQRISKKKGKKLMSNVSKKKEKHQWTVEETDALLNGHAKYRDTKTPWARIKKDNKYATVLKNRTNVDLKDKWRNISNAAQKKQKWN